MIFNSIVAWQRKLFWLIIILTIISQLIGVLDCVTGYGCDLPTREFINFFLPLIGSVLISFLFAKNLKRQLVALVISGLTLFPIANDVYLTGGKSFIYIYYLILYIFIYSLYLGYKKIPKKDWLIMITSIASLIAGLVYIHVPIAISLQLSGVCSTGNAFSYSCSNTLADISFGITNLISIFMIVFYAPLLVWLSLTAVAIRNIYKLSQTSVEMIYGHKWLLIINKVATGLLLLPLIVLVFIMYNL